MKIGDKLVCANGHTYTLGEGSCGYTFSLIDENEEEVNLYQDYALSDCMPYYEEDAHSLCVGTIDGCGEYTHIIEFIES